MQNILQDELGRIITLSKDNEMCMRGLQCIKASAQIVSSIAKFLSTSLGPFGRDKLLIDCDGSVVITNDGATILKNMVLEVPIAKMILKLSESLDDEIGDGTTSVVILANSLLQNAVELIQKGLHPTCITEGYEKASMFLMDHLDRISDSIDNIKKYPVNPNTINFDNNDTDAHVFEKQSKKSHSPHKNKDGAKDSDSVEIKSIKEHEFENPLENTPKVLQTFSNLTDTSFTIREFLLSSAKTSLNSKVVNKSLDIFSRMCVDAVLSVFDFERHDMNFDLIKIYGKEGADLSYSKLFHGVVLSKEVSHPEMPTFIENAKFAILACPLEPPKMKTKHTVAIKTLEDFNALCEYEKDTFDAMINKFKEVGANVVICQWGFDDEANHLLAQNGILAVRWVGGTDLEQVAVQTSGNIVSRIEDIDASDLGSGSIHEISLGTEKDKSILIKGNSAAKMTTICLRATNKIVLEEVKRSVHDALCAVRNLLVSRKITYGGGASEISGSLALRKECSQEGSHETRECYLAVSRALEEIPFNLAMNIGADPVACVASIKEKQMKSGNHSIGVSIASSTGDCMKSMNVYDALISKQKQISMAIQLACSIIKIDNMTTSDSQK